MREGGASEAWRVLKTDSAELPQYYQVFKRHCLRRQIRKWRFIKDLSKGG